jgi:hypothetical protein
MLSGEPLPVHKEPGTKVFAGTINQKGSFRFRAEKVGAATMLAQIIRMVQEAQGSKSWRTKSPAYSSPRSSASPCSLSSCGWFSIRREA